MIILFDFDGALFNTELFKDFLREKGIGVSADGIKGEDLSSFVFADTKKFLKQYADCTRVLLTAGDTAFQKMKVENAGLADFFDTMIFADGITKAEALERMRVDLQKERVVFIDDRIDHLLSVALLYPRTVLIRIKRPGNPYNEVETSEKHFVYYEVENLAEASGVIENEACFQK